MKRYALIIALLLIAVSFLFNSCRPPELEGAIVHLNAGRDDQAGGRCNTAQAGDNKLYSQDQKSNQG